MLLATLKLDVCGAFLVHTVLLDLGGQNMAWYVNNEANYKYQY